MPQTDWYPKMKIRNKKELVKRISDRNFSYYKALNLINSVLENHNKYWHDVKGLSEPDKDKYIRSAKGTPLGILLGLINEKVLAPYDKLIPHFIFGGISNRSHVKAAFYLLGKQRKRTKLSLDIKRFFEHNKRERIFYFFHKKCECGLKVSNLLADLCCVPIGPKNCGQKDKVVARGFATSGRLAVWCNLNLFLRVYWMVKKVLKNNDAKIAIYVDDIGISASRVEKQKMELIAQNIEKIFNNFDMPLNPEKKDIRSYSDGDIEYLGLRLGRKITLGKKTREKANMLRQRLKKCILNESVKNRLIKEKKAIDSYKGYLKNCIIIRSQKLK